jgi:hypothetical protein
MLEMVIVVVQEVLALDPLVEQMGVKMRPQDLDITKYPAE